MGEVLVRGAQLFDRYWGRPEATEEAITEEGWFQTGKPTGFAMTQHCFIHVPLMLFHAPRGWLLLQLLVSQS